VPGKRVGALIFFSGIFRFALEFIREPDAQLTEFARVTNLHMGQWLTVPMIVGGIYLMVTANKRRIRAEPPTRLRVPLTEWTRMRNTMSMGYSLSTRLMTASS